MARWQELCELLLDKELTPQDVVEKLGVKPCRLKQMLESKRLADRLELVEKIAAMRADHAILLAVEAAAGKLAALAAEDNETGRKACLDVLGQGRLVRTERQAERSGKYIARWRKLIGGWGQREKRPAARQAPPPADASPARPREEAPLHEPPPAQPVRVPRATRKAQAAMAAKGPPRMSNHRRRELAGLPPEKTKPGPVHVEPAVGHRVHGMLPGPPGGRVVQHIICGKVFQGTTGEG